MPIDRPQRPVEHQAKPRSPARRARPLFDCGGEGIVQAPLRLRQSHRASGSELQGRGAILHNNNGIHSPPTLIGRIFASDREAVSSEWALKFMWQRATRGSEQISETGMPPCFLIPVLTLFLSSEQAHTV